MWAPRAVSGGERGREERHCPGRGGRRGWGGGGFPRVSVCGNAAVGSGGFRAIKESWNRPGTEVLGSFIAALCDQSGSETVALFCLCNSGAGEGATRASCCQQNPPAALWWVVSCFPNLSPVFFCSPPEMLSLKKYFTEGLIQFTILLSLIGVRVDVDTYLNSQLPPLREIILGQSSAYTQTQFHNLRNTLDGYGIHPKSVDLDYYFTARRLLNQVRALDRFQVPTTEVSAWLVHRDPDGSVSGTQPSAGIALENSGGLQDGTGPDGAVRESGAEQGFGEELEDLGAVAAPVNGDLTKEVGGSFLRLGLGGSPALASLLSIRASGVLCVLRDEHVAMGMAWGRSTACSRTLAGSSGCFSTFVCYILGLKVILKGGEGAGVGVSACAHSFVL